MVLLSYGDRVDNTVEENYSVFCLIRMCWLPSVRAITQLLTSSVTHTHAHTHTHTHTRTHVRLTALCPGLPGTTRVSRYQKGKPVWILLKQETVSGSGISWVICNSAPRSRQITTPAPYHSVFYRLDALPATQPTVSKH